MRITMFMAGAAVVASAAAAGGPEYPEGPTNLTLIEQTRWIETYQPTWNPDECAALQESYLFEAQGFEPVDVSVPNSTYESSILEGGSNLIDMSADITYWVACEKEPEYFCCQYNTNYEFTLKFELHEVHAFRFTGYAGYGQHSLQGPVDVYLWYPPDGSDFSGVLPPGVYVLHSNGTAFKPENSQTYYFDLHIAALNHPLDADGSGVIDEIDLAGLLAAWGECDDVEDCDSDADGDGFVGLADLIELLSIWGQELTWEPGQPLG